MKSATSNVIRVLSGALLAGFFIFVASLLYIRCSEKWVGALFFSLGLLVILVFKFPLFTGTVGYVRKPRQIPAQIIYLVGNLIGCLPALLFECPQEIIENKLSQPWYQMLVMSIVCGMLIYTAVEGFHQSKPWLTIIAVAGFVLVGAEHCIADWCFLLMSRKFTIELVWFLPIIVVGNICGAQLMRAVTQPAPVIVVEKV